jgi:hypothetical protein
MGPNGKSPISEHLPVRRRRGGINVGFSLDQFSEVLSVRDTAGRPYILIGGQAVNYWAERYLDREPQLQKFRPFTSAEIDFQGTADDVRHIAEQLALTAGYPPKVAMTALAGVIPVQIGGETSNIEVVRHVPGVGAALDDFVIEAKWGDKNIRVLNPISLLASKLELAATVSQDGRNDVLHLKILVPCVRAFLETILEQVEQQAIPARDWLGLANRALKLTTDHRARRIGEKHQINWPDILPLKAINQSRDEKIRTFRLQQLEQGYRKSKGISI